MGTVIKVKKRGLTAVMELPGEVGVRLRFSEEMDTTHSPTIVMEVNETGISVESTPGWVSDDTWQGRCTLPEEEGEVHIGVSGVRDLALIIL